MPNNAIEPILRVPQTIRYQFQGILKTRLAANLESWLLSAPQANPAMLEMFRDREHPPGRNLLPWSGEFSGKYLTSAVLCYRLDRDERLRRQIDRFVDGLMSCQAPDGYLGPFSASQRLIGRIEDGSSPTWDLWGHYHNILGLVLWYRESGYQPALDTARRTADYIIGFFAKHSLAEAGWQEMNLAISHGMAVLYQETGEPRYLAMLRTVEEAWQGPDAGDYVRTALAGTPFYATPKPRWESLHSVQAIRSLYEITGDPQYLKALLHIWQSIRSGDRHNTGGFSSGEQATGNPYDPRAIETCCSVAWMALTADVLQLTADPTAADELELSTYNAALGAQHPSGRWWTYNTPMDGVRQASAHEIVFQARAGSPELNCCSVNGPRSLGMLSEWALLERGSDLVLNCFGPHTLTVLRPTGTRVTLTTFGEYPLKPEVEVVVECSKVEEFTLYLHIPGWSVHTRLAINFDAQPEPAAGSYLAITRSWGSRTSIKLTFDFTPRWWLGERECAGTASLYRGPLLLACDQRYNRLELDKLPHLSLSQLTYEPAAYRGAAPAPDLIVQVRSITGHDLILCDFASAGSCGTPYRTWLPITD